MAKYTKEDIIEKANELARIIANTEEVDFFKRAEEQINQNQSVQQLIARIKLLQKESVNLQHYQKHEAYKKNEEKIDQLNEELDSIPIVKEFKQSQVEVNDLLQLVSTAISTKVTDEIIDSTGGDLLAGKTGSALKVSQNHC